MEVYSGLCYDMKDDEHLDYSASSGSMGNGSAEYDAGAPKENDGRSKTVTGLNPKDADKGQQKLYKRLAKLNDGKYSDYNGVEKANQRRDAATICSQLDCTTHQQNRVFFLIDTTDLRKSGYNLETGIIALITFVCNEDGRMIRQEYHYKNVIEKFNTSKQKIREARKNLHGTL